MAPLQQSDYVVQNRQTWEQMTHLGMLNKATKFEFFSQLWSLNCKGLIHAEMIAHRYLKVKYRLNRPVS